MSSFDEMMCEVVKDMLDMLDLSNPEEQPTFEVMFVRKEFEEIRAKNSFPDLNDRLDRAIERLRAAEGGVRV